MIRVLILEDDPMVAEFNKRYLEQIEGFQLQAVVSSVDEALAILDRQEIDLILLDIFMPGRNGLDLLSEIREKGEGVDVILITAASDIQSVKKALRYGAVDYLIKPFEFERFRAALSAYREEVQFMKELETLSQEELDKRLLHKEQPIMPAELPKGLMRNTLKTVWETIQDRQGAPFSTEELANRVGISRVSMSKYLKFLVDIGAVEVEISYGSVGRPVYKYRSVDSKSGLLKTYL